MCCSSFTLLPIYLRRPWFHLGEWKRMMSVSTVCYVADSFPSRSELSIDWGSSSFPADTLCNASTGPASGFLSHACMRPWLPNLPKFAFDCFPTVQMLKVQDLQREVNERIILTNITFSISSGEILFVRGPSGVGKSLLLRAIAYLDPVQVESCFGAGLASRKLPQKFAWRRGFAGRLIDYRGKDAWGYWHPLLALESDLRPSVKSAP